MHFTDPEDLSPLSFGAGLALGLMLILGLPRAGISVPTTTASDSATESASPGVRRGPGEHADANSLPRPRPVTVDAHR